MSFASGKSLLAVTSNSEIGNIQRFGSISAPIGYLVCNGQAVLRSTYAELFNVIGTTFGVGDGSTTFNLPFDTSLKQYSEADGDFTITGTNWTTASAVAIPYQDSQGNWRLKFNISGTISSATSDIDLTFSGVTFAAFRQAVAVSQSTASSTASTTSYTNISNGIIRATLDATSNNRYISGDVFLTSKPTFVDDNGSDYKINQFIRYLPKTALQGVVTTPISILTTSSDYGFTNSDGVELLLIDDTSSNRTATLPAALDNEGRKITIKNISSDKGKVTVDGDSSETIDGYATIDLDFKNAYITIVSDGIGWRIQAENLTGNQKQYSQAGGHFTVTGTNWTTTTAMLVPYRDLSGNWRLRGNIYGTVTSGTRSSYDITISGIDMVSSAVTIGAGVYWGSGYACSLYSAGDAVLRFGHASIATTGYSCAIDIALDTKPTWVE